MSPPALSPRPLRTFLALGLAALAAGCVSVRRATEEDLPAAWRAEVTGVSWRLPQGRFAAEGQLVAGAGRPVAGRLEEMFFPGQFRRSRRADVIEVTVAGDGTCTARAWRSGQLAAELTLPGQVDPRTGWLELKGIPVRDTQKFGALATTQSIRIGLGSDGALYVRAHATAAGVVLFLPAVGSSTVWGRWESARP